jgi:hypothetical protein
MNDPSEYELLREKNIRELRELEQSLFLGYSSKIGGPSISRRIMEQEENMVAGDEQDEIESDPDMGDNDNTEIGEIDSTERNSEESEHEELELEDSEDLGSSATRHSLRLQYQMPVFSEEPMDTDYRRSGTPPPPEEEREEPWDFANVQQILNWREFSKEELFQNIHQIEDDAAQENINSKRGNYKSTTTGLDKNLESTSTRRFVEWRRVAADGLSNEALDELLDILHSPGCDNSLLPRNHYHLEQLQDRATASFRPKTTRWRIPSETSDAESEEITITDIEHLIALQLQDPEIAQSIITGYSHNDGIISHPSHCELWKKLATYDAARSSYPLGLKVLI